VRKRNKITLFDLDKTLITCDSLKQLVFFLLKTDFLKTLSKLPFLFIISIFHFLSVCDHKTKTKSVFLSKLLSGYTEQQTKKISIKFSKYIFNFFKNKKTYQILLNSKRSGDKIFIVTASPDFYCKHISALFGVLLISTKTSFNKKGILKIVNKNCYGYKKKNRVLKEIKNFKKKYSIFYTDSKSDIPLMQICNKAYFVKQ
jgi:hypothetical protein